MKETPPEQIFYNLITTLITNLLINNKSYKSIPFNSWGLMRETKERAEYILERMEDTKHLIGLE